MDENTTVLTDEVKEVLREQALSLVEILLLENVPFRIVLWNNDNWNMPLPDTIMEAFPTQLVLDIKQMALAESYVDEQTGEVIIATAFEGKEYLKVLEYDEIVAVLDLAGQPMILNNFKQDNKKLKVEELTISDMGLPKTKEDLMEMIISDGVPEEAARRSINIFMKNNQNLLGN